MISRSSHAAAARRLAPVRRLLMVGSAVAGVAVGACTTAAPAPRIPPPSASPLPAPTRPSPSADSARATPRPEATSGIAFAFSPGRHRYLYAATAEIVLEGDTTRDSLWSSARLGLEARSTGPTVRFSGTIDSLITRSKRRSSSPQPSTAPIPFAVVVQRSDGRIMLPNDTTGCATPAAAGRQIAELLTWALPPVLPLGTTWTDTIARSTCRGGIAVRFTAEARYTVLPNDTATMTSAPVPVRVVRLTRGAFGGSARIGGSVSFAPESVSVAGEVIATDTIALSVASGSVASLSGGSELLLTVAPAGRQERYRQRTRYQVVPLP